MRVGENDRLGKRDGEDTGCAARVFIIVHQGLLLVSTKFLQYYIYDVVTIK